MNIKKIYSAFLKKKESLTNSLFGNKDYKKFVMISRSRTGSTLLMALLNKHNNVICEGELFKDLNGKSCLEIWNSFYSNKPRKIGHVGFKLFYYHPFDEDKKIWDIITKDKTITIIHLTRKNYLEAYLSQKIGEKTKKWTESKYKQHNLSLEERVVTLNFDDCKETFEKIYNYESETVQRFKEHNFIEIDYQDLNSNKEKVISSIFEKFGVPNEQVEAVNKKQNAEPLEKLIENYSELKKSFANTKWAYLFE